MEIPIVVDLRLLTFAENLTTERDIEEEHQRLHKNKIAHIHKEKKL